VISGGDLQVPLIRRACFFGSGRYRLDPDTLVEMFTHDSGVTSGASGDDNARRVHAR
jgi:hypothetical protein